MKTFLFRERYLKNLQALLLKNIDLKLPLQKTLKILQEDPFYKGLKTHKVVLSYDKKIAYVSRITGDYRIAWRKYNDSFEILEIIDIGCHSGRFQMYQQKSS